MGGRDLGSGVFLFFFGTWGTLEESFERDWRLHQNFNFLLLADVSNDYWWTYTHCFMPLPYRRGSHFLYVSLKLMQLLKSLLNFDLIVILNPHQF